MCNPTSCSIHIASNSCTCDCDLLHETQQRLDTFTEPCDVGEPVVHLRVHVDRPLALPRWPGTVVPDALQIRGLSAGTRARDEQVTCKLKVQRCQGRIDGCIRGAN